ncbi:hypothetical protein HK099_008544 [Clydaea vesicula]|uniref:30S ribosomal protein S15, chloroplastic n=1 Tax=Clydaea vesicula TaxID=447962 RepID=A0AAD5XXQ9_9FUNG|nr:hypothetical protein HK099_008544 [Clydaea vesicula]KAJ3391596.1 hypothetical protein HDU92_008945 [Lobulomyces angularis]
MQVKVTRRGRIRYIRKQKALKEKLGDKYVLLKKIPELNPPMVPDPVLKVMPYLATQSNFSPRKIPIGQKLNKITQDLELLKQNSKGKGEISNTSRKPSKSIREMTNVQITEVKTKQERENLHLKVDELPLKENENYLPSEAILPKGVKLTDFKRITKKVQVEKPYFSYGLANKEVLKVLNDVPNLLQNNSNFNSLTIGDNTNTSLTEQAELVRRSVSLENASAQDLFKFNKERLMAIFGKHLIDSGSSSVQAAIFTLRIVQMKEHLKKNKKDISTKRALFSWESKRTKVLRYLRKKDIKEYVLTCKALGISPQPN